MSVVALEMRGSETGEGALVGCRTCFNLPEPVVVIVEEGLKQACSVDRLKKAYQLREDENEKVGEEDLTILLHT